VPPLGPGSPLRFGRDDMMGYTEEAR